MKYFERKYQRRNGQSWNMNSHNVLGGTRGSLPPLTKVTKTEREGTGSLAWPHDFVLISRSQVLPRDALAAGQHGTTVCVCSSQATITCKRMIDVSRAGRSASTSHNPVFSYGDLYPVWGTWRTLAFIFNSRSNTPCLPFRSWLRFRVRFFKQPSVAWEVNRQGMFLAFSFIIITHYVYCRTMNVLS